MAETKIKSELRINRSIELNQLITIVGGTSPTIFERQASGICLDTRDLLVGDVFFAMQSARDGHEFVGQAAQKGASAVVVSKDCGVTNQIIVSDTLKALWDYARWVRDKWGKKVISLSGSNGKTTTKEFLATLLGPRTLKTPGTWNNFLGVPLTLLKLNDNHEFAVIEMGINHFGELLKLCEFTLPDAALLTNVGPAHLEEFRDLDGVAKAKSEIFSHLESSGTAILNIDDEKILRMKNSIHAKILTVSQKQKADVCLLDKQKLNDGYQLSIQYGSDKIDTHLSILGEHNISNFLCALGGAKCFNISASDIEKRTATISQVNMRMEIHRLPGDRILINDCYNANPGSFQAALQTVSEMKPKRFLLLMGDMLEMGVNAGDIHRELAKKFAGFGVDYLYVTGGFSSNALQGAVQGGMDQARIVQLKKKMDAVEKILSNFNAGDILLVKASRGIRLEEAIDEIERRLKG